MSAGIALLCLLGALGCVMVAGMTDEVGWLLLAAPLLLVALADLALLVVLLLRDPFRKSVLERLAAVEAGLGATVAEEVTPPRPEAPPEPQPVSEEPEGAAAPPPVPKPAPPPSAPAAAPAGPPHDGRSERPSLELLLGGRALGIVGSVVLVVAVGLFLKFAWDQGWFRPPPALRVALGIATGFALVVWGEAARRRERYRVLAQVLVAAGLGTIYVSAWAAHGLFHLVSATTAFLLVAAAAAVGVAVAVAGNSRAVASLSAAGGFLAPLVVELPDVAPLGLYAFVLVLDAAVLAVASSRRWPELGPIALAGTGVLASMALRWRWPDDSGLLWDAAFLLLAALVFYGVALGFAWRRRVPPTRAELVVLAVTSMAAWGAGLWRLDPLGPVVGGAWTVLVLLLEIAAADVLLRRIGRSAAGRQLFLALAFLLLTALPPVVWDGAWVAAAWALEAAVAGALALRGGSVPARWAAAVVAAAAAGTAAASVDGADLPAWTSEPAWLRLAAALLLVALLALVEHTRARQGRPSSPLGWIAAPAGALATIAWLGPEVERWSRDLAPDGAPGLGGVLLGLVLAAVGAALLAAWPWRPHPASLGTGALLVGGALLWTPATTGLDRWAAAGTALPVLTGSLAILALVLRCRQDADGPRRTVAIGGVGLVALSAVAWRLVLHWPGEDVTASGVHPAAVAVLATVTLLAVARLTRVWPDGARTAGWVDAAAWLVAVAGSSRLLAVAVALAGAGEAPARRAAVVSLSVLWGASGLALVLAGLLRRHPGRRLLGLTLLVATAVKVFLVDLATADTIIRIVAFLVTGLALVSGSYLYARFRERLEPQP